MSAVGYITITDYSALLTGGAAAFNINGLIVYASSSVDDSNHFIIGSDNISTASSLVNKLNTVGSGFTVNIHQSNYGGFSATIRFEVSASIGAAGNSYGLSCSHAGVTVSGFSGGVDGTETSLHSLITVSGQPYMASRGFYDNTMRFSYIRVKMRFVFSASAGRWITSDYRQFPTSYLTPSVGNQAFAYKAKSVVKSGADGSNASDYIHVTASQVSSFTNKDYLWEFGKCFNPNASFKELWCRPYSSLAPLELRRFCLPFLAGTFPYADDGTLLPQLDVGSDVSSSESYRFVGLETPVSTISFITPDDVNGGKLTPNTNLNAFQPHLWSFYWHIRPATSAMGGCDIPSKTSRAGGVMSSPTLHNMFNFPPMINSASSPGYIIPSHLDMTTRWL